MAGMWFIGIARTVRAHRQPAVDTSGRQEQAGGGEAMPSQVAALPHVVALMLRDRGDVVAAEDGATRVTLAVCTHELKRFELGHPHLGNLTSGQSREVPFQDLLEVLDARPSNSSSRLIAGGEPYGASV